MIKVLDETVSFYEANPDKRSIQDVATNGCLYFGDGGRCCAVGRLIPESWADVVESECNDADVSDLFDLHPSLQEEIDLPIEFLSDLQIYHDRPDFWYKTSISRNVRSNFVHEIRKNIIHNWY